MAKRKRRSGRRRKYISVLGVIGTVAAIDNFYNMSNVHSGLNNAANQYRQAVGNYVGTNPLINAAACVALAGIGSSVANNLGGNTTKIPLGRYGVKL